MLKSRTMAMAMAMAKVSVTDAILVAREPRAVFVGYSIYATWLQ